ncbi:MAG: hypothetical protein KC589_01130, partial [Nanoarchaeota archaeon]|nr:hypothetical protein [Nanoarchaeota archaeon]
MLYIDKIALYLFFNNLSLLFQKNIYEVSITVLTFFITITFSLIGFSINKISKYKLNVKDLLSYSKYFILALIYYLALLLINIFFNFFNLNFPYNFISLIFLFFGVILFLSLVIFTLDTFHSENLFDFISKNTQNFIKKNAKEDKIFKKGIKKFKKYLKQKGIVQRINKLDVEFQREVETKFEIIFGNLLASINKNDILVSKKILEEIPNIVESYLDKSKNFEMNSDSEFAQKLNDNYNFVFESLQNSYNEKLYENFIISISNTSLFFLKQKKLLGMQSGNSVYFLASMKDFFLRIFKLKRTSANHIIIKEISKHILLYDKEYQSSHNPYESYLSDIEGYLKILIDIEYKKERTDLTETFGFWSTSLYRNIIKTKRDRFLIYLTKLEKHQYVNENDYYLNRFFEDFYKNFNEVKSKTKYNNIFIPTIFGLDSFLKDIVSYSSIFQNDVQKKNFY